MASHVTRTANVKMGRQCVPGTMDGVIWVAQNLTTETNVSFLVVLDAMSLQGLTPVIELRGIVIMSVSPVGMAYTVKMHVVQVVPK